MSNIFATYSDGEYMLTMAGFTLLVVALVVLLILVGFVSNLNADKKFSTRQITFSAIAIAIATVTSNIKLFHMPMGGSVTLLSMLFVCLIGYWYGMRVGIVAALAYGLLQMMMGPYIISFPQLMCDYLLAFGALGLAGIGRNKKHGLTIGYLIGVFGRFVFSFLSGVIFFASYAPETMSPAAYSAAYNGFVFGAEALITVVVINIPPVKAALEKVRSMANGESV